LRERSRPRVLSPSDIDRHEQAIVEAFRAGEPQQAWDAVRAFILEVRQFSNEAGRARFLQNLGTSICDSCEGLKAGPDVVATCFQLKQCFYTNKKSVDVTAIQQGLIEKLTSGVPPK
jgi:hypothetical protein